MWDLKVIYIGSEVAYDIMTLCKLVDATPSYWWQTDSGRLMW